MSAFAEYHRASPTCAAHEGRQVHRIRRSQPPSEAREPVAREQKKGSEIYRDTGRTVERRVLTVPTNHCNLVTGAQARPSASASMRPRVATDSRPWSRSARAFANASGRSAPALPAGCGCGTTTGPTTWLTTSNRRSPSSASTAPRASCGSPKATASRSALSAR